MPDDYAFTPGKAYVFHIGKDVNIIANGIMVGIAKDAASALAKDGIDAGVINMSTVKPLDEGVLLSAAKSSGLVVTAEEHSVIGGLGSAVSEYLSENCPVTVKRIGINDSFGCSGNAGDLMKFHGITADDIVARVKESLKK